MPMQLFQVSNIPTVLQNYGIYQYILPFLLALAIFYGVLKVSLGDKVEKSAISLISLVLAFFVMLFTSWNVWVVSFFAQMGGSILVVVTCLLAIIIFLGLFGIKSENIIPQSGPMRWAFILTLIFIAVMIFLGAGAGWLVPVPSLSGDFAGAILVIIIIALAMWWMSQGNGGDSKSKGGNS